MPDSRRVHCKRCARHRDVCGQISWRGLCVDCAKARSDMGIDAMGTRQGPTFEHWRYQMAASVGYPPLDDPPPKP